MRSKKGAVLAYVLIIGAGLMILAAMAVIAASSSISMSDTGVKSREAYLNAKSGIEYSKIIAQNLGTQVSGQLAASPASIATFPLYETRYAYYDKGEDAFHSETGITATSSAFQASPIQITYLIKHVVKERPQASSDSAITYDYDLKIKFTSVGRSNRPFNMPFLTDSAIKMDYVIKPLKGSGVLGGAATTSSAAFEILSTGSAFDCDISQDMSCYLRGDDTTAALHNFNNSSTSYAADHSIVFSKTLKATEANAIQRANKMYFLGNPLSINVNRNSITGNTVDSSSLYSNYIYINNDISFSNIRSPYSFSIYPLSGDCIVFFDNVKLTVSYYPNTYSTTPTVYTKTLNGFYSIYGNLFRCYRQGNTLRFDTTTWNSIDSSKETDTATIKTYRNQFDPYLVYPEYLGIQKATSGRTAGWTADTGTYDAATSADYFTTAVNFLVPPAADRTSELVIMYANSFNTAFPNTTVQYKAKQIRLATSMADSPPDFNIPAGKKLDFKTDIFSYYGGDITDSGTNNSFSVTSLSGKDVVPIYFARETYIGNNVFPAGYALVTSGTNLLDDTAQDSLQTTDIWYPGETLSASSILLKGNQYGVLRIRWFSEVNAVGPTTVTIDASDLILSGIVIPEITDNTVGDLVLTPPSGGAITMYIVRDMYVRTQPLSDWQISKVVLIKAGFYRVENPLSFLSLLGDDSPLPPGAPTSDESVWAGTAFVTDPAKQEQGYKIEPVFIAPGITTVTSEGYFMNIPIATMGGIYY